MSATSDIDRVWEIAEKIKICMLTTHAAGRMRCRPMHAIADRAAGCLWFVTDDRGAKDNEISAAPDVCLAFADTHSNAYLSVTGQAEMSRDPTKARELWSTEAQALVAERPRRSCCARAPRRPRQRRILGRSRQCDHGRPQARSGPADGRPAGPRRGKEGADGITPAASRSPSVVPNGCGPGRSRSHGVARRSFELRSVPLAGTFPLNRVALEEQGLAHQS
jgi:general stress protein 26